LRSVERQVMMLSTIWGSFLAILILTVWYTIENEKDEDEEDTN
jgi:hypothetical protein